MRKYILDFLDAAEVAAVNAASFVARGDKNRVDEAAVNSLRQVLNEQSISVKIITGEGVIDQAPQLSLNETLGKGGEKLDMAVDPVDGTTLAANGQPNSVVSLAVGPKDSLLSVPDMYMEKLICSVPYVLDFERSIEYNIRELANRLHKSVNEIKVAVLNKPRHRSVVDRLLDMNVQVHLINDGDILATLDVMKKKYDLIYSIGGAPEGIVSACICKSLGGDMSAKLVSSSEFKETSDEYRCYEEQMCKKLNLEIGEILPLSKLVKSNNIFSILTAVTDCPDIKAPIINYEHVNVQSVIIEGYKSSITYTDKLAVNVR